MCAYASPEGAKEGEPGPIPDELAELAAEYREKLLDAVVETDEALMERYLEGEELDAAGGRGALKAAVTSGDVFPVACGVATKNLGTHALLDLLVEGVPSPAKKGSPIDVDGAARRGVRLQDGRRSVRRPHQPLPGPEGHGHRRHGARQPALEREGAHGHAPRGSRARSTTGARLRRGRPRLRREAEGRADRRSARRQGGRHRISGLRLPGARHELRDHAEVEGRRGEVGARRSGASPRRIRPCGFGATSRRARRSSPA